MNIIIKEEHLKNLNQISLLDTQLILKNQSNTGFLDIIEKLKSNELFSPKELNNNVLLSLDDFFKSECQSSFFNSSQKTIYLSSLKKDGVFLHPLNNIEEITYTDTLNYNILHEYGHFLFDTIKFNEKSFISGNIKNENKDLANILNTIVPLPLGFNNLFYKMFYNSIEEGFSDTFAMIAIDKLYLPEKSSVLNQEIYNYRKEFELFIPDYLPDTSQNKVAYFNSNIIKSYIDDKHNNNIPDFKSYKDIRDYILNNCIKNLKKTLDVSIPTFDIYEQGKNILYQGLGIMYRLNNENHNNTLKYNYYLPNSLEEFNKNMKVDFSCILGTDFKIEEKFKESWDDGYCKADSVFYAIQHQKRAFENVKPFNSELKVNKFKKEEIKKNILAF